MKALTFIAALFSLFVLSSCMNKTNQNVQQPATVQEQNIRLSNDTLVGINSIISNPGLYKDEKVRMRGHISQYIPGDATTTSYYYLKGDFGEGIKVITLSEKPEVLKKYEVVGIVNINLAEAEAYLVEHQKICLDCPISPPPPPQSWCKANQTLCYIIIGGALLLLLLVIVYFILRSVNSKSRNYSEIHPYHTPPVPRPGSPVIPSDTDFQTIKISHSAPKTLKLLPGKLQIVSGLDKGKEFKMQAFPTATGGILTIGREKKSGDAEFSHIQLLEKTVSRQQAELVYKEGKLYIKNLSETNYTQLNGKELQPGEMTAMEPNSIIKTGEVEFKYVL
jgi:hypothetical protein